MIDRWSEFKMSGTISDGRICWWSKIWSTSPFPWQI